MRCLNRATLLRLLTLAWLALALAVFCPAPVQAVERADIEAGLKTLPLLMTRMTGDLTMAVVYDSANPVSKAEGEKVKSLIDAGIQLPGGGKLTALPITTAEIGKLSRAKLAYLTSGLGAQLNDVAAATAAASILTLTMDIDCVRVAHCIIGVETKPSVTIYFSKTAADDAKIEFVQAFNMVVKQP